MAQFELKIITSNRVFYAGSCHCLILPATDGERAVMAHHENAILAVCPGEMRLQCEENGPWTAAVLGQGFCEVANNRVTLLSDTVERPEEIDRVRAQEAYERARERLRQKQNVREYHLSQAALARALSRLREVDKRL